MTLADDLQSAPKPRLGKRRCLFGKALDAFPDEAALILEKCAPGKKLLERRGVVIRVLDKNGHQMADATIDRHMRMACVCYR